MAKTPGAMSANVALDCQARQSRPQSSRRCWIAASIVVMLDLRREPDAVHEKVASVELLLVAEGLSRIR